MKSKNVLSALLAVMMVLSMMTAIAMPAVAAEEKTNLPSIQTATSNDSVTEYAMASVADLIWWGQNPTAVNAADTVYLTNDLDIAAYGATFSKDFTPIRRTYASLNGQGHTIYGYNHGLPIFSDRYYGKSITNLIIDNAYITSTQYGSCIIAKALEADCLFENVHIRNSVVVGSDPAVTGLTYGYHALFCGYMNNRKSDFDIIFRNCSITNSTMDCKGWSDCGLWFGVFRSGGQIRFENCVTLNSNIINFEDGTYIAPYGRARDSREVYYDNIAAFGCKMIGGTANQNLLIASGYEYAYLNNLFATGNLTSSLPGMTEADTVPLMGANIGVTSVENYLFDSAIPKVTTKLTAAADKLVDDLSVASALIAMNQSVDVNGLDFVDWALDPDGNPVLLEEGSDDQPICEIIFKNADGTKMFALPTDTDGFLVVDDATLAVLKANHWQIENGTKNYPNDTAWETIPFNGHASFTCHEIEAVPHATDARYHTITCTMAGCTDSAEKVACTGVQQTDLFEEAGYFTPAVYHYKCAVCGQAWSVEDQTAENPAMITLDFQKEVYDAGEMIALDIGVNANANLDAFELELAYDTEKLSFTNYIVFEDGVSGDAQELDKKMKLAAYAGIPSAEAGKWMTVYFKAAENLTADTLVEMTSLMTVAVVDGEERTAEVKTKTAADEIMLYAGCTPGDVNRNGKVELLDAVLIVDALNGSLDEAAAAIFSVRAANVDGDADNTVTTNDVTYLLRNLLDWNDYRTLQMARPGTTLVALA